MSRMQDLSLCCCSNLLHLSKKLLLGRMLDSCLVADPCARLPIFLGVDTSDWIKFRHCWLRLWLGM